MNDLENLRQKLRAFADARDWDQFHSPKNLSMALSAEVGELLEHFQWLTEAQSEDLSSDNQAEVEKELADIFIYLVRIADRLGIDLVKAANKKIELNEKKYPAEKVKGSSKKYTEY